MYIYCNQNLLDILSLYSAVKQFGRPVYERVNRHDVSHKRPICVIGKLNDELTHFMSSKSEFKICKNVEDVLETCSKVCYLSNGTFITI